MTSRALQLYTGSVSESFLLDGVLVRFGILQLLCRVVQSMALMFTANSLIEPVSSFSSWSG